MTLETLAIVQDICVGKNPSKALEDWRILHQDQLRLCFQDGLSAVIAQALFREQMGEQVSKIGRDIEWYRQIGPMAVACYAIGRENGLAHARAWPYALLPIGSSIQPPGFSETIEILRKLFDQFATSES